MFKSFLDGYFNESTNGYIKIVALLILIVQPIFFIATTLMISDFLVINKLLSFLIVYLVNTITSFIFLLLLIVKFKNTTKNIRIDFD